MTDIQYLVNEHKIISDMPLLYEMPRHMSVDINTSDDLKLVMLLMTDPK